MWALIRNRKVQGLKFRRQYSIGMYIVDFYCPVLQLVVEVDGATHYFPGRPEHDAYRQQWLKNKGMRIIRFNALDVIQDPDGVLEILNNYLYRLKTEDE